MVIGGKCWAEIGVGKVKKWKISNNFFIFNFLVFRSENKKQTCPNKQPYKEWNH